MPVYEYQCRECGHRFEVQQHAGDPPPACPQNLPASKHGEQVARTCGGRTDKQISRSSFVLMGGGWARDGYGGGK